MPDDPRLDSEVDLLPVRAPVPASGGGSRRVRRGAADNAVRPLSAPFDIRWKLNVDEEARMQLEAELGWPRRRRSSGIPADERGRTAFVDRHVSGSIDHDEFGGRRHGDESMPGDSRSWSSEPASGVEP